MFLALKASAVTLHVDLNSANPTPPYAGWSTAATNIQDAIDASSDGDLILVTNGVYQTGGRTVNGYSLTNRVVINKAITIQSVNGPAVTVIGGYQMPGTTNGDSAVRCVYMTNNAVLIGFTLTNGATRLAPYYADQAHELCGGGIWCEDSSAVVSNCVLSVNVSDSLGGGAFSGTLYNCTLTGNSAVAGGGADGCTLNNCTLSNNIAFASTGGGAYSSTLNNCVLTGNSAPRGGGASGCTLNGCSLTNNAATADYGGGADGCTLSNCILSGNSAISGGGAALGTLGNCILISNLASSFGGGTYSCNLSLCTLLSNSSSNIGGGTYSSTLTNCTLTGNSAVFGGGADLGTLNNCILSCNAALDTGGGANSATINNCALVENSAINNGGGTAGCILGSCTLTGNSAFSGGGTYSSLSTNCIVYYNNAVIGVNYDATCSFGYSCTTPLPANGSGNITDAPELADRFHLSAGSPCIGAGNSIYVTGVDIDGEPWANPPAIGCDEFYAGAADGQLDVAIQATFTNLATGFAGNFVAQINGHATMCVWDFGDGIQATNRPYVSHAWATAGAYPVTLWAFNESNPAGVNATITIQVTNLPVQYVDLENTNPIPPYLSWATAATNIQDAVDTAYGGGVILVSNGVYQTGGRVAIGILTNRVVISRPVTVESVNGPSVTMILGHQIPGSVNGDSAVRCAYLTDGAKLIGFTLANGATRSFGATFVQDQNGGGIWCQSTNVTVSNCIIVSNSCLVYGAGAYSGTLVGCQINNNTNQNSGSYGGGGGAAYSVVSDSTINSNYVNCAGGNASGGAFSCVLSNCVIDGNSMGGVCYCTLNDCAIENNTNAASGGGASQSILNNCGIFNNQTRSFGGGAYDCELDSCVVSNNQAIGYGGGVCDDNYETNAPGQSNYLAGNSAGYFGGGLYFAAGSFQTNWNIINWTFSSNSAASDGGGLYSVSSRSSVNTCTFVGNSSGGNGGGCSGDGIETFIVVSNSTFTGNTAVGGGGGAYFGILNACSAVGNKAANGGGIYGISSNCVINNNVATTDGGGLYYYDPSFLPIANCAFTNNLALNGGGAYTDLRAVFSNCVFSANSAVAEGGGVDDGTLVNCLLTGNSAAYGGGVGQGGNLNNCTIVGNSAVTDGGGIYGLHHVYNSIIYYNTAPTGSNYLSANLTACCTTPLNLGTGNITNAPAFIDQPTGNYRLQTNSPCINAGNNSYAFASGTDLDGNPRIVGGTVDIGAYECQSPALLAYYTWLQNYNLPTSASTIYADSDGDGMNNYQEWIAGTDPTNPLSLLEMLNPTSTNNPTGLVVSWESVSNITYFLQSSTNLGLQPAFSTIQSNILGQAGTTSFTDASATNVGPYFYRVGVQQ
ncbi:MAG: choice-of-anchor Q domain-containing protein [Verrucomicrobiia bacterium]